MNPRQARLAQVFERSASEGAATPPPQDAGVPPENVVVSTTDGSEVNTTPPASPETPPPESKPKPEDKTPKAEDVENLFAIPEAKKPGDPPAKPAAGAPGTGTGNPPPASRDYSGVPEEWVPFLKNQNNAHFAPAKARLQALLAQKDAAEKATTELAELKKNKPGFLLDHPDAFKIDPEYVGLQNEMTRNAYLRAWYTDQWKANKAGKDVVIIKAFDDKGNPVTEVLHKGTGTADPTMELELTQFLSGLQTADNGVQQKLATYNTAYKADVAAHAKYYADADAKFFPGWDDAKLTAEEKGWADTAKKLVPPRDVNHPLSKIIVKTFVQFQRLVGQLRDAHKLNEQLKAQLTGAAAGGGLPGRGAGSGSDPEIVDIHKDSGGEV